MHLKGVNIQKIWYNTIIGTSLDYSVRGMIIMLPEIKHITYDEFVSIDKNTMSY